MRKTKKQLKKYYCDNFAHTSQLDAIKEKTGFFDVEEKSASKKNFWLRPSFYLPTISLIVAVPLVCLIFIPQGKENTIPQMEKRLGKSVITMNANPSISFTLDEKGVVNAVYGENNDGKIVLLGESILNKPYEEAIAKVIDIERECGYLANSTYEIKVYSDSSVLEDDFASSVDTYLKDNAIDSICKVTQSQDYVALKENLYSREKELTSFDEYYDYLYDYYQENEKSLTKDYEAFYEMYRDYSSQIASYQVALKDVSDPDVLENLKTLETRFDNYFDSYFNNFIETDSPYQKYFTKLIDAKSAYLVNQNLDQDTSVEEKLIAQCMNNLESYKKFITEQLLKPRLDDLSEQFHFLSTYVESENISLENKEEEIHHHVQQMEEAFYANKKYSTCQNKMENYLKEVKNKMIKAIKGA